MKISPHKRSKIILLMMILIILSAGWFSAVSSSAQAKLRVAYLEGEPYLNYAGHLGGLAKALAASGEIEPLEAWYFEDGSDDAGMMWHWLQSHGGERIQFVSDEFYQLNNMTEAQQQELVRHWKEDEEVDLILAMGTAAGKFIRTNGIPVNTMIMSVTNAQKSGIVDAVDYSGVDNLWAHMSPDRYYNQLLVFYQLFQFQSLGVVYEDSDKGRNEIPYQDLKRFAAVEQIQLIEEKIAPPPPGEAADPEEYQCKLSKAYAALSDKADAIYLTPVTDPALIPHILDPAIKQGLPIFAQSGKTDVQYGATLTIYRAGFSEIGAFCAERFLQILEGVEPGDLSQNFDETQTICINLAVAEQSDLQLPFTMLLSADTIFTRIGAEQ